MRCIPLALLAFTPGALVAQATIHVPADAVRETYDRRVPVSGAVVVGVVSGDGAGKATPGALMVRIPAGIGGTLCVSLTSVDGRYLASFTAPFSAPRTTEWVSVRFPSSHGDAVSRFAERDVAIEARLGCDGAAVPAAWSRESEPAGAWVLVNSGQYRTEVEQYRGAQRERTRCSAVTTDARRMAFDLICPLTSDATPSYPDSFKVVRRRLNTVLLPVTVRVAH